MRFILTQSLKLQISKMFIFSGAPIDLQIDSTMTVHGALKLLHLSTAAGSAHTLKKIREGYKTRALEIHPDAGGSTDEMRRLNEAYQLLKNLYRK